MAILRVSAPAEGHVSCLAPLGQTLSQPTLLLSLRHPLCPQLSVSGAAQGAVAPSDPKRKGQFTQVQSHLFLGQSCLAARRWIWALFAYSPRHRVGMA